MKIIELFDIYNFHDSLLESAEYLPEEKKLVLDIDFCLWQQDDYCSDMPETEMLRIVFSGVSAFYMPEYHMNSDQIIDVKVCGDKAEITVFNDLSGEDYTLTVSADSVDINRRILDNGHWEDK